MKITRKQIEIELTEKEIDLITDVYDLTRDMVEKLEYDTSEEEKNVFPYQEMTNYLLEINEDIYNFMTFMNVDNMAFMQ